MIIQVRRQYSIGNQGVGGRYVRSFDAHHLPMCTYILLYFTILISTPRCCFLGEYNHVLFHLSQCSEAEKVCRGVPFRITVDSFSFSFTWFHSSYLYLCFFFFEGYLAICLFYHTKYSRYTICFDIFGTTHLA